MNFNTDAKTIKQTEAIHVRKSAKFKAIIHRNVYLRPLQIVIQAHYRFHISHSSKLCLLKCIFFFQLMTSYVL